MKEKATGGIVRPQKKIKMITEISDFKKSLASKSLSIIRDRNNYYISINEKLAKKLDLTDGVKVMPFLHANALIVGKHIPFPKAKNYKLYEGDLKIVDAPYLAKEFAEQINLDIPENSVVLSRKISYQPLSGGCFATVFFK